MTSKIINFGDFWAPLGVKVGKNTKNGLKIEFLCAKFDQQTNMCAKNYCMMSARHVQTYIRFKMCVLR